MKKLKIIVTSTLILILLFSNFVFASNSLQPVGYGKKNEVGILTIICDPWSGWADWGPEYCKPNVCCAACNPILEGRFVDQRRRRECYSPETGDTWVEYEHRTVQVGCCGMCFKDCYSIIN